MRKIVGGAAALILGLLATIWLGIAPASALALHVPGSGINCTAASVSLVSYDAGATAEIIVDGATVHSGTFGGHLVADYPVSGNVEHTLIVNVDSHDGDQYDYSVTKTTSGCYTPPPPVVEQHDESGCVSTTEYRTHTWTTTDGVVSDEVDTTRTLTRQEAIDLGCYTPPVVDCPEHTVPGWLNEHGDPTSCVGDHPCPQVPAGDPCPGDPPVTPPTTPEPPVLALSGTDPTPGLLTAWALVMAGLVAKAAQLVRRRA